MSRRKGILFLANRILQLVNDIATPGEPTVADHGERLSPMLA
jgi:hypothetical protein